MVRVSDILTTEETRDLRRKSDLVGALLVMHAYGVIFGAMAVFVAWPNPLTLLLAVMVIGTRQLGLSILMHDAAHGLLFANRQLNDWVGEWLCAYPVATSMARYRPYHLTHHRNTQQADDPDLGLSAPFPITPASLRRKILRDLTGRTGYQRRKSQFDEPWPQLRARERGAAIANLVLLGGLTALGHWYLYPLLWVLPNLTWYQLVTRLRNIAEHAVVPDNDDPLRNTRTTYAGWLERAFIAPYWVNYHLEHHLLLFVPCWRLPAAHRLLLAKGLGPRMELKPGYRAMLKAATAKLVDGPGGPGRHGAQHI